MTAWSKLNSSDQVNFFVETINELYKVKVEHDEKIGEMNGKMNIREELYDKN